jgi:RimJ/RimL family protein N-acetyltransferase
MLRARVRARSSPVPSTDVIAATVSQYWNAPFAAATPVFSDDSFVLMVNPALAHNRRAMVLRVAGEPSRAVVTPDIAVVLGDVSSEDDFAAGLEWAGIRLNGADNLYYFEEGARFEEPEARRLTSDDAELFARFEAATSEQDRDDAFVELDHWAVFGVVADGELVSAASAYPWADSPVADMGVLTVESARGAGHGRRAIRALSAFALSEGFEPQYRCQLDNAASVALAGKAGLTLYGTWDVVAPD